MKRYLACFALPCLLALPAPSKTVFLHYRWHADSLTLVEKRELPVAGKVSRKAARRQAAGAAGQEKSPFSYELVSARGEVLAETYLPDPGLQRVEYQEPGSDQMRMETAKADSSDIFLKVSDPKVSNIRFYRHGRTPSGSGAAKAGAGKTLLAEFPL